MKALIRTIGFLNSHPIAKRNRAKAYYRFVSWQLRSRLNKDKFYVIPFIGNTRFFAKSRLTGITGSIYTGLHDFEEMSFMLHFLRKEDCFFDVGSNVGAYTILAAGVSGSKTVSFEPNKTTFEILQKNICLNRLQSLVQCENKAVGSNDGVLKFTIDGDTTNHVFSQYDELLPFDEISVVPLDAYSQNYSPAAMKVDVEGFEAEVINGAQKILTKKDLKAIIIELNGSGGRYGFDEQIIHQKLIDASFEPYSYDPLSKTLTRQETFGHFNTLYIRDFAFVMNRLNSSPKFKIWSTTI
jgi:FkbM family methyltransferase